jgi:O-antigen/teichoic acid export membrane protein
VTQAPGGALLRGRLLARNSLYNLLGQAAVLLLGFLCIPVIIGAYGTQRFGILALAWVLVGYLSLLDFGIGRGLVKLLSEELALGRRGGAAGVTATALVMMAGLGLAGMGVLLALARPLAYRWLQIPESLQEEVQQGLWVLALMVPVSIVANGFRGVLEAQQRFGRLNLIRVPSAALMFLGPLAAVPFSGTLVGAVIALMVARALEALALMLSAAGILRGGGRSIRPDARTAGALLRLGGWMAVTNALAPLMVYVDRLIIATLISARAVAYYATPHEVISRMTWISRGVARVLFPAFSAAGAAEPRRVVPLFTRALKYLLLILYPITLLIVGLGPWGLLKWLGAEYAEAGGVVARWLAVGLLVNSLARVPRNLVQALGRPDWIGKLQLAELPVYLATVVGMTRAMGIEGTAMAWTLRVSVDALVSFWFAQRLIPVRAFLLRMLLGLVPAGGVLAAAAWPASALTTGLVAGVGAVLFAVTVWVAVLDPQERAFVLRWLRLGERNE